MTPGSESPNDYRPDDIDRRIIYELMRDARNTSAPTIADAVNVSPGTIRNRIDRLEERGVIQGYSASIDFERADGRLTTRYLCTVPIDERERLARNVEAIQGVVTVSVLMNGRRNLHVTAVGDDQSDIRRISRALTELGVDIEDEMLVHRETTVPYGPFGPEDATEPPARRDRISLAGDATVVDVTVREDAEIAGRTLEAASREGVLPEEDLVVAIERNGQTMTPHGETEIRSDDVVTVLFRDSNDDECLAPFLANKEPAELKR